MSDPLQDEINSYKQHLLELSEKKLDIAFKRLGYVQTHNMECGNYVASSRNLKNSIDKINWKIQELEHQQENILFDKFCTSKTVENHPEDENQPDPNADLPPSTADEYLSSAQAVMSERGKTYDGAAGERSMAATVRAFNATTLRDTTGTGLSESDGWLLMFLLKQVRQSQSPDFHADSALDSVAYAALLAESQSHGVPAVPPAFRSDTKDGGQ